jgi:general secretion pathway protein E
VQGFKLVVLAAFLAVTSLFASEVKLRDGRVYNDVTILGRDDQSVEIAVAHGEIRLPLSKVESIDSIPVPHAATETPATEAPKPVPTPKPHPEPMASPYVHRWDMDIFLLIMGLTALAWIGIMIWVQHDVKGPPEEVKRTNADVLLLPVLGFVMYLIKRQQRLREREAPKTLTGKVAALAPGEVPKKRGLFGGRTRIAAALAARKHRVGMEFLDVEGRVIKVQKDMPEMTGIEAAREVLQEAMSERASDVHLEPQADGCRVRFRVDGALQERLVFTRTDGLRVVAALKTLAQIDVAEKRRSQDGRFRVRTENGEVDFRAATANAIHGEKLVLRILDRKSGLMGMSDLGMSKDMMERFERVIHSRHGIILVAGPTGSGKTSTLYAALSRLDRKRLNIMSIEDPVEYELEGATQLAVNPKAGITYEAGLRSILRQDPDVIFVGEMRDAEASKIAIRAALTGHLVFSSLHARNAVGTVVRLQEIGVETYQISSALLVVLAQRLVRVLCKQCSEPYEATGTELEEIGMSFDPGTRIYRPVGCEACDNIGYQGRTGIFEMLVLDEELRKAINDGADEQTLWEIAAQNGLRPYRQDGAEKILMGITSVEEVIQAS